MPDGSKIWADELEWYDENRNIAVLEFNGALEKHLRVPDELNQSVGDTVYMMYSVGHKFNFYEKRQLLSIGKTIDGIVYYQLSGEVYEHVDGAILLNDHGEIIGIVEVLEKNRIKYLLANPLVGLYEMFE